MFEGNSEIEQPKYPEISQELIDMGSADREMREKSEKDINEFDEELDRCNTQKLKEIVNDIGWPSISAVGRQASSDAWLVVQHATLEKDVKPSDKLVFNDEQFALQDLNFQEECLRLMSALPEDEVQAWQVALLTDRVKMNRGEDQVYGTQFSHGKVWPIEDLENLDARRGLVGLEPFAEYQERMLERYARQSKKTI